MSNSNQAFEETLVLAENTIQSNERLFDIALGQLNKAITLIERAYEKNVITLDRLKGSRQQFPGLAIPFPSDSLYSHLIWFQDENVWMLGYRDGDECYRGAGVVRLHDRFCLTLEDCQRNAITLDDVTALVEKVTEYIAQNITSKDLTQTASRLAATEAKLRS